MRAEHLLHIPLLCPRCHCLKHNSGRREAHRLMLSTLGASAAEGSGAEDGEILWGGLSCPGCGFTYPIIDGIPLLHCNLQEYCNDWSVAMVESEMPLSVAALVASYGPANGNYTGLLEDLSMYMDAAWGDSAEPPPDGPAEGHPAGPFGERVLARAESPTTRAIDLGTGLGRSLSELQRGAEHVVGVDYNLLFLRRARRLLAGERVGFLRRMAGHYYAEAHVKAGERAAPRALLVCADALNPPFELGTFGRAVAANLLDKVDSPGDLFFAMDELLAPGGELLLTSPIAWSSHSTRDEERIGQLDPGAAITERFREGIGLSRPYAIEEQRDIAWWLRGDSRVGFTYNNYYLRARKP